MTHSDIELLYAYDRWANQRILEGVSVLHPGTVHKRSRRQLSLHPRHAGAHPRRELDLVVLLEESCRHGKRSFSSPVRAGTAFQSRRVSGRSGTTNQVGRNRKRTTGLPDSTDGRDAPPTAAFSWRQNFTGISDAARRESLEVPSRSSRPDDTANRIATSGNRLSYVHL